MRTGDIAGSLITAQPISASQPESPLGGKPSLRCTQGWVRKSQRELLTWARKSSVQDGVGFGIWAAASDSSNTASDQGDRTKSGNGDHVDSALQFAKYSRLLVFSFTPCQQTLIVHLPCARPNMRWICFWEKRNNLQRGATCL